MNRAVAVLMSALALGCMHGQAVPVRVTSDGGTLLLERGSSIYPESEPVRAALRQIEAQCGPAYEITALELVPVSYASDITTTHVTYLCRKPVSTALNAKLQALVKGDDEAAQRKEVAAVAAATEAAASTKLVACQAQRDCNMGSCIQGYCRR